MAIGGGTQDRLDLGTDGLHERATWVETTAGWGIQWTGNLTCDNHFLTLLVWMRGQGGGEERLRIGMERLMP
jgi:hypothetical protein